MKDKEKYIDYLELGTLVFLFCELKCNDKIITSASGVWKILKVSPSNLGPGG